MPTGGVLHPLRLIRRIGSVTGCLTEGTEIRMARASRRDFLVAAGTGAAAAGVLAAVPTAADAAPGKPPRNAEPLVAHIADPDGAELIIHRGERSTVVRDRDLVVRLLRAAGKQG
jgi:hypothetical protein